MLEVVGLVKRYGAITAVDGVSLTVNAGETIGLLGPNGAGKTTTVSIISGLVTPDAGEVRIDGRALKGDTDPLKRKFGLVPQELALFDELTALDNLQFFGALYDMTKRQLAEAITRVLDFVGLADRAKEPVKNYSGGMKRRLNMAASLLHEPEILLLDEPTVGIDPQSRNAIFDNLEILKARGMAIVYTTHYMEEAQRLCDRLVIVDRGRVVATDTLRGLSSMIPKVNRIWLEFEDRSVVDPAWLASLGIMPGVKAATEQGGRIAVDVDDLDVAAAVFSRVADSGGRIAHFVAERADLETVFLTLTGRSLRDS